MIHIQSFNEISKSEIAERKGLGHPDAICDAIAEEISSELSKYYLAEFGAIQHYNVDKALLVGGLSSPKYRGGTVNSPIELIIAGHATFEIKGRQIPVEKIAVETATNWLNKHMRFLDLKKHMIITPKIRPGSTDLIELFQRAQKNEVPLANDTAFGAGYYPLTPLEEKVLDIEKKLNDKEIKQKFPFLGEDIKVMGVQTENSSEFTVSIAIVDRFVSDIDDYILKIKTIHSLLNEFGSNKIDINTADDYANESVFLTVTGTSAEAGDHGQIGRGNRFNGLITPYKPMTLEAFSGKNPINHIGKLYNFFAHFLSRSLCNNGFAEEAQVFMVSQIGRPITKPQLLDIKLKNQMVEKIKIEKHAQELLSEIPLLWKKTI